MPDFPDPTFGAGGAQVSLSTPPGMLTSATFELAQKDCAKLGLGLAGYVAASEKPSAATMARMRAVAQRMRAHGVPNFSDPRMTTLLTIMGTLERASSGRVQVAGQDVGSASDVELAGLRAYEVGSVIQEFHLQEAMSAVDNVALGMLYTGQPRSC